MYILLFLLVFIVIIFVLGLSIVGAILRAVFGIGRRSSSRPKQTRYDNSSQKQYQQQQNFHSTSDYEEDNYSEASSGNKRKKIFTKDEGEYVDFEEIK